jgi:putative ABC transport system permease protein
MQRITRSLLVAGVSEALATIRQRPLRALLAATAMAAAVATTAIVQTTLDGLARAARDASARAFGSDSFVIAKVATGNVSRRELAQRLERNRDITRADVRFLETMATDRVMYAAIAQRSADVVAGGRRFERAAINGTHAALFDIRDVGLEVGRPFTRAEEIGAVPLRLDATSGVRADVRPGSLPAGIREGA